MSKAGGGSGWNRLPGNGRCRGLAFSEPNPGSVKDRSNARHSLMPPCSSELNRSWLEVRIVDDKTGEPIAVRVVISDGDGKAVEIEGKHPHVGYLAKRRCYVDGAFSLAARATP